MGKGPESMSFQRRHANGQQVHENVFNSTIIRVMQIKSIMRYHFTPVRMAIIKKTRDVCW